MAIRFDEEYDPDRSGIGLRPMGRNAAGNRGISLKKGDYVIGAAITNSEALREAEREECAKREGLTDKLTAARKAYADAEQALTKAREDYRNKIVDSTVVSAAEKALENAWKAIKTLDEKLCVTQQLILSVTEQGYGKRTDVDQRHAPVLLDGLERALERALQAKLFDRADGKSKQGCVVEM